MTPKRYTLGFLASHRGSNLQAILDACSNGTLDAVPAVVISNNRESGALERARQAGIAAQHLSSVTHPDPVELDDAIATTLQDHDVDMVVLAGYMRKLGPKVLDRYAGQILNIHPSLLPRHGGHGMFGDRVHASVLETGDSESGATVHLVTGDYDTGPILAQAIVPVLPDDDVKSLGARVLVQEHRLYISVLQQIIAGTLTLSHTSRSKAC